MYKRQALKLVVKRLPIASELLVNPGDVPTVLPSWMHKDLEIWIAHEYFSKHDTDVYDPLRAGMELVSFTDRVGSRPTAKELVSMGQNRRRTSVSIFQ